jgi:hypothetical protein
MRAHGVPNFPDPTANGGISLDKTTLESPQYQTASHACQSLAPAGSQNGGTVSPQLQTQALQFARCMRSHGVADFPDPSASGPGGVVGIAISRNVSSSPSYRTAAHACRSLIPNGRSSSRISGGGS